MVLDKIEIEREMFSNDQIKIDVFYNTPIGNAKKLVSNFFDTEKLALHYKNLQLILRLGLKLNKILRVSEFNQSQCLKTLSNLIPEKNRIRNK